MRKMTAHVLTIIPIFLYVLLLISEMRRNDESITFRIQHATVYPMRRLTMITILPIPYCIAFNFCSFKLNHHFDRSSDRNNWFVRMTISDFRQPTVTFRRQLQQFF